LPIPKLLAWADKQHSKLKSENAVCQTITKLLAWADKQHSNPTALYPSSHKKTDPAPRVLAHARVHLP
jgi:hypothetical protein